MFNRPSYEITQTNKQFSVVFNKGNFLYAEEMEKKANISGFEFTKNGDKAEIVVTGKQGGDADKAFRSAITKANDNRLISLSDVDKILQTYNSFQKRNGFEAESEAKATLGHFRPDGNAF